MELQTLQIVFSILILVMSVVIHEVSHGFAAALQGDPTAKLEGRLTLNPLKHLDLFGSFLIPLITYLTAGITFGWAKPVPYNPYNFRNQRWGEMWVALAGPASNLIIALVFGLIIRFGYQSLSQSFIDFSVMVTIINIGLAAFNLIPIPPLDGSKVLFALIPYRYQEMRTTIERFSLPILLLVVFFGGNFLGYVVSYLLRLIVGV